MWFDPLQAVGGWLEYNTESVSMSTQNVYPIDKKRPPKEPSRKIKELRVLRFHMLIEGGHTAGPAIIRLTIVPPTL